MASFIILFLSYIGSYFAGRFCRQCSPSSSQQQMTDRRARRGSCHHPSSSCPCSMIGKQMDRSQQMVGIDGALLFGP